MSLMFFSGFETGDFSEWVAISSAPYTSPTVQDTIKKTGTYAARCNPTANACSFQTTTDAYKRLSFQFYVASLPLEEDGWVHIVNRSGINYKCGVKINSNGQIQLAIGSYDGVIDYWNSNFQLSTEQWCRICVCVQWNVETERGKTRLYVDGTLVCSDDDGYSSAIGFMLGLGTIQEPEPAWPTCDIYYDDIVYDDDESLEDMGDMRVLRAGITGAGEYAEFDSVVGSATHYENVDELLYSDDDYNYDTTDDPVKESYVLENCSTIGLVDDDTIKAIKTLCRMKTSAGGKAQKYYILRRDNGIDYEELASVGTSFVSLGHIDEIMPNGGGNWTQDRFNALEVGMYCDGSGARDPYLSCVAAMIAFSPPLPPSGVISASFTLSGIAKVLRKATGVVSSLFSLTGSLSEVELPSPEEEIKMIQVPAQKSRPDNQQMIGEGQVIIFGSESDNQNVMGENVVDLDIDNIINV